MQNKWSQTSHPLPTLHRCLAVCGVYGMPLGASNPGITLCKLSALPTALLLLSPDPRFWALVDQRHGSKQHGIPGQGVLSLKSSGTLYTELGLKLPISLYSASFRPSISLSSLRGPT